MNIQRVLTTAVLGVGLGALTLPGIALANVGAHPGVAPVGTTITLTARCKPQSKGPTPSATFHITGPRKDDHGDRDSGQHRGRDNSRDREHQQDRDRDNGRHWDRDTGSGPGTGTDSRWDRDSDEHRDRGDDRDEGRDRDDREYRDRDHDAPKDVTLQSTGTEPKMPDTVSAQLQTHGWKPGEYRVTAKCNDGTVAGETTFTLTPEGGPRSGEGGPTGDNTLVAAGTAMLGAGAAGLVLLRRRRAVGLTF